MYVPGMPYAGWVFPIYGMLFKRLIFNSLYKYLEDNKILLICQSSFRSSELCVSQPLSIVANLYKAFEDYLTLETRGIFLNISEAFDKV